MVPRSPDDAASAPVPFDCEAVLDATIDALLVHDREGRIVHVNRSACAMFGYERREFANFLVADLSENVPPYTQTEALERAWRAIREGVDEFHWRSRRKNGELFWSEVTLRHHREGVTGFIIAIIRDITERKKVEDALRESEEKLSKIFHGTSNAMAVTELNSGRIIDVNKAWISASGISREAALGRSALELGIWTKIDQRDACQRELEETGHVRKREVLLSMADGQQNTLLSAETIILSSGTCALWELIDISELRRSEAAAREREERLRTVSVNFDQGMFYQLVATKDGGRRFSYVSDSVRILYGVTPEEVIADPTIVFNRHHPEDRERLAQIEAEAFTNLTSFRAQVRIIEPSGGLRWSSVVATPKAQTDGTVIWDGVELIISDLKRAEEERASLEKQLQHAQRMESVGRLAGGVAHDFNNMLGVIMGQVELALEDLPEEHPVRANLLDINKAARQSKDLTSQLLAFARKQAITPRVIDLNDAVAGTLKMLQRLIRENIRLVWRPATHLWSVKIDVMQLDQILANLCVNARDAISGAGTVTIETANEPVGEELATRHPDLVPGDFVRLSISDDGCGMDRETLAHVFEPFFTTKEIGVGTGLGLSTVYGIVRQNGGIITVWSEPGKGACFVVYLPRHSGTSLREGTGEVAPRPKTGSETVLLVEDDPALLAMLSKLLRRYGYTVLPASTSDEALTLASLHAKSIQLLISDVVMPGMNGRELAERIAHILPGVPRLFMSGYTANVIDRLLSTENRVAFLQKPFSAAELTEAVRRLVEVTRS